MGEGAKDIFKKRKDEGHYSTLIGRYMMASEIKLREFFRVSRDIFHLILTEIKEDTTRSCNRRQTPISPEQKLSYSKVFRQTSNDIKHSFINYTYTISNNHNPKM
jgi:hypothetical protein